MSISLPKGIFWFSSLATLLALTAAKPQDVSIRAPGKPVQSAHRPGPNGLEGWTDNYPVVGRSKDERYPMVLVIARDARVLQRIEGEPFVWKWIFWSGGREVAFEAGPFHSGLDCVLADSATGRRLATYDCFHGFPRNAPGWVKALEGSTQPSER